MNSTPLEDETDMSYPLSRLITDLQAMLADKGDVPVRVEGCDCTGRATGLSFEEGTVPAGWSFRHVLIERDPN